MNCTLCLYFAVALQYNKLYIIHVETSILFILDKAICGLKMEITNKKYLIKYMALHTLKTDQHNFSSSNNINIIKVCCCHLIIQKNVYIRIDEYTCGFIVLVEQWIYTRSQLNSLREVDRNKNNKEIDLSCFVKSWLLRSPLALYIPEITF